MSQLSERAWRCEHCGEPYVEAVGTCPECLELALAVVDAAARYVRCQIAARLNALSVALCAYARASRRPCPFCGEALKAAEDREAGAHAGDCLSAERWADAGDREDHRRRDEGGR